MKLLDYLDQKTVVDDLAASDKKGVLEALARPVADNTQIDHREVVRVLLEREKLGSTGIGHGIGIPHGKLRNLKQGIIGIGRSRKGIPFDAIDNKPAQLFFLLLTPDNSTDLHLKLLARISKLLRNTDFKEKLLHASGKEELLQVIADVDEEF